MTQVLPFFLADGTYGSVRSTMLVKFFLGGSGGLSK